MTAQELINKIKKEIPLVNRHMIVEFETEQRSFEFDSITILKDKILFSIKTKSE